MTFKLYECLEVNKNASLDEIKKAYKKKAFLYHPDKNKDNREEAEIKFKEVTNAYEVLSNEDSRNRYDQLGDENYENYSNGGGDHHVNPMDLFNELFGRRAGGGMGGGMFGFDEMMGGGGFSHHFSNDNRCKNIVQQYEVSLEDVYNGISKNIKINVKKYCKKCIGKCDNCNGKGMINQIRNMGFMTQMITGPCDKCRGKGYIVKKNSGCSECKGSGNIEEENTAFLNIPKGFSDNYKTIFKGFGEQPKIEGQIAGDLILEIKITDHKNFVKKENDLYYKINITFTDSILGKEIVIPYFDEEIKKNTLTFGIINPKKQYLLKNKGLPIFNTNNKGNLFIEFNITYPNLNKEKDISELRKTLDKYFLY